jgi:hypothetical protein
MGKKLTKDEYLQKRVFPLLERAHQLCVEREIALFFTARCSSEGGVVGIVASNEEGETIPFAREMIALRQHHEVASSGIMDAIHDVIFKKIKEDREDCTGDCAACVAGKSEVEA